MQKIAAVATLATSECAAELGLMIASLHAYNPSLSITVGVSTALMDLLHGEQQSVQMGQPGAAAIEYLRGTLSSGSGLTVVPCLDQYGPINRRQMERQRGVWYSTRHCDFMMEKANIMEYVLCRNNEPNVLFLDCDITSLAPLPQVPHSCQVALSPHSIRKSDTDLFGYYNGGCMYISNPAALFEWRKWTHRSRYFDQASLENVAEWAKQLKHEQSFFEFGPQVNYGYWRMFQSPTSPTQEVERFTVQKGKPICYQDAPLQSVHTHFFLPVAANPSMAVFNQVVKKWVRETQHHLVVEALLD